MYEQKHFIGLARALLATKPSITQLVQNTEDVELGRIITSCIAESFGGMPEWRTLAEAIEEEANSQGRLKDFGQHREPLREHEFENGEELFARHGQIEHEYDHPHESLMEQTA
jgi:hypothetical protein